MTMTRIYAGFYTLVQFCADTARGETSNVGIAVISPELRSGKVITGMGSYARSLMKASALGQVGASLVIQGFVERLEKRLKDAPSRDTLDNFTAAGANPVSLSAVREMTIRDLDADANRLFRRLVETHGPRSGMKLPRVTSEVGRALEKRGVMNLLDRGISVELPQLNKTLEVPYGFRNGKLNLVAPTNFNLSEERVEEVAAKYALTGEALEETGMDAHLIVVGRMNSARDGDEKMVRSMLERKGVDFLTTAPNDLDHLANTVRYATSHH